MSVLQQIVTLCYIPLIHTATKWVKWHQDPVKYSII